MTVAIGCGIHTEYKTSSVLGFWFMQQGENRKGKNNNTKKKNQYLMFIQVFTGEDLGFGNLRFVTIKW